METTTVTQPLGKKIFAEKSKQFIFFTREGFAPKTVRYNLASKTLEIFKDRKQEWLEVDNAYWFFKGVEIENIEAEPKFKELLNICAKFNKRCKSVSAFFCRLDECLIYEPFVDAGIKVRVYPDFDSWSRRERGHFKHPFSKLQKDVVRLLAYFSKENDYELTCDTFNDIVEISSGKYKTIFEATCRYLCDSEYTSAQRYDVFRCLNSDYRDQSNFMTLVWDYKYEYKALIHFLLNYLKPFENVTVDEGLRLLKDYYNMASDIGRNVKKYPKYLKSMHDIIMANYDAHKREYDAIKFEKTINKELELTRGKYCVKVPLTPQDITSEGTTLNHCVSSYVDRIIEGKTYICFLRMKETPDVSLVTLEICDGSLIQARGSYNRSLSSEEKEWLDDYCKTKKLEMSVTG